MKSFVTKFRVNRLTLLRIARTLGFDLRKVGTGERRRFAAYLVENRVGPSFDTNYVYLTSILNKGQTTSVQFCEELLGFFTKRQALSAIREAPETVQTALETGTPRLLSEAAKRQYRRVQSRLRTARQFASA